MGNTSGHKAGFVNIIGLPNAGKSTLTNALLGMQLTIINAKPQTTRHRIHAILNGDDYQIVIADTPGYIKDPEYAMQNAMNHAALSVLEDADLLLFMHDLTTSHQDSRELYDVIRDKYDGTIFLLLSKNDQVDQGVVLSELQYWQKVEGLDEYVPISSATGTNLDTLMDLIIQHLPQHPPYYDKEFVSDRNERFFVSEIIRNQILEQFSREIPYSTEVVVTEFKEHGADSGKTLISAVIYVLRNSQRQILIGKEGRAIKKLGMHARKQIEEFLGEKIYLDLTIKIRENWRNNEKDLKKLGY